MVSQSSKSSSKYRVTILSFFREFIVRHAYSVIMMAALFCTLTVKFFHSWRYGLLCEYPGWIMADLSVLIILEVILSLLCYRWPKKAIVRTATVISAIVCTWSVLNAGWLIRTGTQILPRVLLPVIRAPINSLWVVGVNLAKMPAAAVILLAPSAIALAFLFYVLAKPKLPVYNRRYFFTRVVVCLAIVVFTFIARPALAGRGSSQIGYVGLRYNSQLRAVMSLVLPDYRRKPNPKRVIPTFDSLKIELNQRHMKQNIILVVLEGIQYRYTSLSSEKLNLTPYLASFAKQGVEFSNTRSSLTHTTKALFALLTGRYASASQDISEAVPASGPYASIATILEGALGYSTAFFQSAKGSFESRPGLVFNLGYDKFWAREESGDPNSFLGYLACDEFSMLKPISKWIRSQKQPFLLTVLCSVTHDPYVVPEWFGTPAKEPLERYKQAISYTDKFLAALDVEIGNLGITDNTIICVIGDHGEAFGEHRLLGHERIAFDEVLRIPFCLRAPFLIKTGLRISEPVSSVDLTPTLLGLLGFNAGKIGFDGVDLFDTAFEDRKVYFAGWMQEGPAGFVQNKHKFIYNPANKTSCVYDLVADQDEQNRIELSQKRADEIANDIITWRENTVFRINQKKTGEKILFNKWNCRWSDRVSSAKVIKN